MVKHKWTLSEVEMMMEASNPCRESELRCQMKGVPAVSSCRIFPIYRFCKICSYCRQDYREDIDFHEIFGYLFIEMRT